MIGEMLCRIRETGPKPGKKPNSVGEADIPNVRRFPCTTNAPSVWAFRTAKAPEVALVMPSVGVSFQLLRASRGRLIPVSQLISVENLLASTWLKVTESVGSGVRSLGRRSTSV